MSRLQGFIKEVLALFLALPLLLVGGCKGNTNDVAQAPYTKKSEILSVGSEPTSYRDYALVSSGNIHVGTKLVTDGPLADVHANGSIQARALSLNISGKITSSNNTEGLAMRSFNYESHKGNQAYVDIRALKVSEYLNKASLYEYYLLAKDGAAVHHIEGQPDQDVAGQDVSFTFNKDHWEITGNAGHLDVPLIVETSLQVSTNSLFIAGSLMVEGDLNATGELNINTGTPFNKALIVDKDILVDKLVVIGRLHGSGTFTSNAEVNILGNAEIDGDVTLYGDARINYLDNVYKAAIAEAQQEIASDPYATVDTYASSLDPYAKPILMLAHSQLFSDVQNKNSVVLFTFVEGGYILNENIIFDLIENNQINDFKFRSYLYGASLDNPAQLQKANGLSPYYANKLALVKKLKADGNAEVKITESLDIAPSNFYHSFEDGSGTKLGTFSVYSMTAPFDVNNLQMLSSAQREQVLYNIVHKNELEAKRELDAKQSLIDQKAAILLDANIDDYTRQEAIAQVERQEVGMSAVDPVAAKAEAEQGRLDEWVNYKDMDISTEEVTVSDVAIGASTAARRWGWVRRIVRRIVINIYRCPPRYETRSVYGVTPSVNFYQYYTDQWSREVSLNNNANNRCTPISASMILNYHRKVRRGYSPLYTTTRSDPSRINAASFNSNSLVESMASMFNTTSRGTWRLYDLVPFGITWHLWGNWTPGYAYSVPVIFLTRGWQHNVLRWYILNNNPAMYSVWQRVGTVDGQAVQNHSMPVIGYHREYFTGFCWKRVLPERKWILVDSTWKKRGISNAIYANSRAYLRFDMRSQYWNVGTMTYIGSY